ncbi:MAG TPA: hypothetical protein PKA88_24960 [Polyangiaceae bacterium]|nr:hypothetical protein [Polyangiaceae bacterium]HMR77393.1 hypothetical protein [Polyangiaceae bacterium]
MAPVSTHPLLRGVLLVVLALPLFACSRQSGPPVDTAAQARAEAGRRLEGRWLLVSFQPEVNLEPMLGALLAAQMNRMVVTFQAPQMHAAGMGVDTTRRYQVTEALGERVSVRTVDDTGVAYDAVGEFRGADLYFESRTIPWRGRGILRRMP